MSVRHPRGTRLAMEAAAASSSHPAATAASGGKGGHTIWLRTHNPDGSLKADAGGTTSGGVTTSDGTNASGGGGTTVVTVPASGGKSGATLAARAWDNLITSIEKYALVIGVVVGGVFLIRKFHLLNPNAPHHRHVPKAA